MSYDIDVYLKSIVRKWKTSCSVAENVVIVSPYITSRTAEIVTSNIPPGCCEINTLFDSEVFINLSSSVQTLINLKNRGFDLYAVENLHAKVILTSNEIVTIGSQNLTNKGHKNIEASVVLKDKKTLREVKKWLIDIEKIRTEISLEMLEEMRDLVRPHQKEYKSLLLEAKLIDTEISNNQRARDIARKEDERRKQIEIVQNKRRDIATVIRAKQPLLQRPELISLELAKQFVSNSAWWHTHSSGRPVRARKHANRIYKSTTHGWALDFGANTFLVGKAIERCCREINKQIDSALVGEPITIENLKQKLALHIRGAVANYDGNEYESYYPTTGQDMMFGAQSIDVEDGVKFMLSKININNLLQT